MKINIKAVILGMALLPVFSQVFAQHWQYEVKPGDTLWSISEEYLINQSYANRLLQFNSIDDPLVLQPGTTISAPVQWLGNLPGSASIVSITGDVKVVRDNQQLQASPGFELKAEDKIITGDTSVANLEFSDLSRVSVFSNTELSFNTFNQSYDGSVVKARIVINSGRLKVESNPQRKRGHRLEIESPSAITAVRGTQFRVGVEQGAGDTVTEVLSGNVAVSAQQEEVALQKLYGTKTETGKAPIKPVRLIEPPELTTQASIETKMGSVSWQSLARARSYRVRVASDEEITDIVYDQRVDQTRVNDVFFPQDGDFYASVRAIDSNDIEGLDAIAKISVNARPEPPLISGPKDSSPTFDPKPVFSWSVPADKSARVQIQVSENEQFDSMLIDEMLDHTDSFVPSSALSPGEYYWRVANLDDQGRGPYSTAAKLLITDQPELEAELDDTGSQVTLSLSQDPSISRYHVQVSRSETFDKIIHEEWVSGKEFSFNTQGSGKYFIRLGIETAAGSDNIEYGNAQKVLVPFDDWKQLMITIAAGLLIIL